MVIYEKIKSRFSRNWSLRNRGQAFTKNSGVAWLLMTEHLIGWFLIYFGGEFVIDMAFGKKDKIFKLALEFLLLAAFYYCLTLYTSAFIFYMVY